MRNEKPRSHVKDACSPLMGICVLRRVSASQIFAIDYAKGQLLPSVYKRVQVRNCIEIIGNTTLKQYGPFTTMTAIKYLFQNCLRSCKFSCEILDYNYKLKSVYTERTIILKVVGDCN